MCSAGDVLLQKYANAVTILLLYCSSVPPLNLNSNRVQHMQQASPAVDCSDLGTYSVAGLGQNLSYSSMQCFPLGGYQRLCLHSQAKAVIRCLQPRSFIAST